MISSYIDALVESLVSDLSAGSEEGGRGVIVPTALAENSDTSNVSSYPFAESASPPANTLLLMAVACAHATAAEVPNSISAYGLTWTQVTNSTVTFNGGAKRTTWFYAYGTPTGGTVTIGFATAHTSCIYSVIACPGAKLGAPRQATTNTGNSTTVTGTLAAVLPGSMSIYAVGHSVNEVAAPPASGGWAELSDRGVATPNSAMEIGWTTSGDLTADPTWATSAVCAISMLEVEASL